MVGPTRLPSPRKDRAVNVDYAWKQSRLPLGDVRLREDLQLRVNGVDHAHVRVLRRTLATGADLEPIKAAKVGKAHYVADGFHRLEAYAQEGRQDIPVLWAAMSLEEARDVALAANVTHGKALSRADKANRFRVYVERGKHVGDDGRTKASRVIAAELGGTYSHETVRGKLKALGVPLDETVEYPGGFKAWKGDEELMAADIADEAWGHLSDFGQTFHLLEDAHQKMVLEAVRDLVATLERGERPAADLRLGL